MAIYNSDGSVKVADAKATVLDRLKSAWAVVTTIANPFSKDTITANTGSAAVNTAVESVVNSPITKTVIAGGLIAGAGAVASKAVPLVTSAAGAAKNAITGSASRSAGTAAAAEITASSASNTGKNLILAAAAGGAAGFILSGSSGSSNKSAIDQQPDQNITPDVKVDPNQQIDINPSVNPIITPQAFQDGTGNILNQNTYTDTFTYTENFSPQQTWTYTIASGEQDTGATADQTASGSSALMIAAIVGAAYLFSKN